MEKEFPKAIKERPEDEIQNQLSMWLFQNYFFLDGRALTLEDQASFHT